MTFAERIKAERERRENIEAQKAEMLEVAKRREARGAGIESATPFDGGVYDPRTGTYKDRNALVDQYEPTRGDALIGGGMQGVSLGWGDEIVGAGSDFRRELARGRLEEQQRAHPWAFGGAEVAGNILTALPTASLATGASTLGTIGRAFGLGATEGAIYGSGHGEDLESRGRGALGYGLLGGGLGAAAVPITAGARKAYSAIMGMVNKGNAGRAGSALAETVARSGRSVDDIAADVAIAAREGQPEYRLADALGQAGQRRMSGIVRAGGDASQEIADFLAKRQDNASDRVASFTADAFGLDGGKTARMAAGALDDQRTRANNILFPLAREGAQPVDMRPTVGLIDEVLKRDPLLGDGALSSTEVGRRLTKLRGQLTMEKPAIDFDEVLAVKEDLGEAIARAKRKGPLHPSIAKAYGAIDSALEAASDGYRLANDTAYAGRKAVAAVDQGAQAGAKTRRAADTLAEYDGLSPEARVAYSQGYGDKLLARMEGSESVTANPARMLLSDKVKAEAAELAADPELLARQAQRETDMHGTFSRALTGSRTADNAADIDSISPLGNVARALGQLGQFDVTGAASGLWDVIAPRLGGQNEGTRHVLAQALMSGNPREVLQEAVKRKTISDNTRRMIEAMIRNASRESAAQAVQTVIK